MTSLEINNAPPSGGVKVNPNQFKEAKDYIDSIEDEMTANKLLQLAIQFGYNKTQLEELKEFCHNNNIDIPHTKLPLLQLWYGYVERMKFLNNEFCELKISIDTSRKTMLESYGTDLRNKQKEVIDSFTQATNDAQDRFLVLSGEVEKIITVFDPNGDLPTRLSQAVLNGVSSGIHEQVDRFAMDLDQALANHEETYKGVSSGLQELVFAQHQQIVEIQEIEKNPRALVDPVISAIRTQLNESIQSINTKIAEITTCSTEEMKLARQASTTAATQLEKKFSESMKSAETKISAVSAAAIAAIEKKTKWEWVKHAVWLGGGVLLVCVVGLTIYFKWFYPWLMR